MVPTEYFMSLYDVTDPRREIILAYTYNGAYFKRPMANNGTGKAWMGPKFWCPGMDNIADGNNQKVFRYADALLMLAESANATDNADLAMRCLNEVKTRANEAFKLDAYPGKAAFFEEVKQERARELMGEYGRKWDLVRWGIFFRALSETSATEYEIIRTNLRPYHEYYPIPDKEVLRSGGILDNPTYK
ncbi:RagB/SusD family nutrient uptake outer membrane protein [Chitinophaga sedimenti]|uniref:RagB/SusD family nutrient uptake outer membrane protein n=1 Tax=Chitinophaga sedimenti TaxID=2033606 RepID=UPI00200416EB|nr:RagB/SusD family nutrient uptake outer membrane protein [Chitinophaga sedimenti]MCK7556776.1 RagB/SusD family nutrient uptake outer membrane protein [Chitinophaga sedimenti]